MELNWENALAWAVMANCEKDETVFQPRWEWDVNFKLDYDGPLGMVYSRFYPPHKNEGSWWEGTLTILFFEEKLFEKEFKCDTLEELRVQVEEFTKNYFEKARLLLLEQAKSL